MPELVVFVVGLILGIAVTYSLIRKATEVRYEGLFDSWRAEEIKTIRSDVLARSRAGLKGKIGEQLAPLLSDFPFMPADARFLGNPIDYVIFDGYTDVKERRAGALREIVFLEIKKGPSADLSSEERRIRDCIARGAVRFETLYLRDEVDPALVG